MKYGSVKGVERPVSRLVQGTVMVSSKELERSFALLDAVFELGCNTFDTAHCYGGGDNERTVGRWVNERGIRDEVVIIGKGAHPYGDRPCRVTPEDITSDLNESLQRFGFDCIDLYLLHRDDPDVPAGPIVEALNEHHRAGRVRAFGGSNWTHTRIREANEYAEAHGLAPFAATSPNYSLAVPVTPPWGGCAWIGGPDGAEAREWYAEKKIPVFAWSSLASGLFSGRLKSAEFEATKSSCGPVCERSFCGEENRRRLGRAEALAAEKERTVPQIALAYVLNQPFEVFPLVGCRSRGEFRANAEALEVELTPAELAWLDLRSESR